MKHEEDLEHFEAEIKKMQDKLLEKDEVIGGIDDKQFEEQTNKESKNADY